VTFDAAPSAIEAIAPIGALDFHAVNDGILPWRIVTLSERHDIRCLIDAEDWEWLSAWQWNYGWHAKTKWKFYAKRNEGAARSTVYMHREILKRATVGGDEEFFAAHHAHHGNGQSLDNRKANLSWLIPEQNSAIRVKRADIPTLDEIVAGLMKDYRPRLTLAQVPFP
jgi:hypothetical protein